VEPILLSFIVFMILSGIAMVLHYTRFQSGVFRTLQIACGAYLIAFFGSHVPAVLKVRELDGDTDWFFAVSENGLLDPSRAMLTPYYIFAVLALMVHVVLGLRTVLLAHNVQEKLVNRIFNIGIFVGILVTILITSAMFNFHVSTLLFMDK